MSKPKRSELRLSWEARRAQIKRIFSVDGGDGGGWSSYSRHFGLGPQLPATGTTGSPFLQGSQNSAQNSLLQLAGLQGLEKWQ